MTSPSVTTRVSSAELFAAYHTRIRSYVRSMVHDPVEAEDLTQEVFLRAHRTLGDLRDPDALVSWLYRIATHICYDRYRELSRQPRIETFDVEGSVAGAPRGDIADQLRLDRVLEQNEMSACVRRYIEGLSTDYRQVIFLHDLEGLTNPAIAEMLSVSLDTVKIRLHRARRKLQTALEGHCALSLDEEGVLVCEPVSGTPEGASRTTPQRPSQKKVYPSSSRGRPARREQRG